MNDSKNYSSQIYPIPNWVKAILIVGFAMFAYEMIDFPKHFSSLLEKRKAEIAYREKNYNEAISRYSLLSYQYPKTKKFIIDLAFSYYYSGNFLESLRTFRKLDPDVSLSKSEFEKIEEAINDMLEKLENKNLN